MILAPWQTLVILGMVTLASVTTRFLPFILLKRAKGENRYLSYLGRVLPYAAMGLLVIYCLKEVNPWVYPHGIPEALSILLIVILHYWNENALISIGGGTILYMFLVQMVFVL